jgi:hypothetical protein
MFTGITTHAGSLVTAMVVLTGAAILLGGAAATDSNQDDQALAPVARADDTDTFSAALSAEGIPALSGLRDLTKTAHKVCDNLGSGESPAQVVGEFELFANTQDPGHDPGQVHRTAIKFVRASEDAFCPGVASPSGWGGRAHIALAGAIGPAPAPGPPDLPDSQQKGPPQAAGSKPAPQAHPPAVGPPPGGGGGKGGNGGGDEDGGCQGPCDGPGIVSLAP